MLALVCRCAVTGVQVYCCKLLIFRCAGTGVQVTAHTADLWSWVQSFRGKLEAQNFNSITLLLDGICYMDFVKWMRDSCQLQQPKVILCILYVQRHYQNLPSQCPYRMVQLLKTEASAFFILDVANWRFIKCKWRVSVGSYRLWF